MHRVKPWRALSDPFGNLLIHSAFGLQNGPDALDVQWGSSAGAEQKDRAPEQTDPLLVTFGHHVSYWKSMQLI